MYSLSIFLGNVSYITRIIYIGMIIGSSEEILILSWIDIELNRYGYFGLVSWQNTTRFRLIGKCTLRPL